MKKIEQYEKLLPLKQEINKRLSKQEFKDRKELILWLSNSKEYLKLKNWDNQLLYLECASKIWMSEKKKLPGMGIWEDIFTGVASLEDLERKYLAVEFMGLRFEQEMPPEYELQAVKAVLEERISGIAAFTILQRETLYREENILKLAAIWKEQGLQKQAICLLQEAIDTYKENTDMRLELADCYLVEGRVKQAYECLSEIEKPAEEIRLLIMELEGVLRHETV